VQAVFFLKRQTVNSFNAPASAYTLQFDRRRFLPPPATRTSMTEEKKIEFARSHARFGAQLPNLLGRVTAVILGIALLILAFMFSLVVLVVAVTGGLLAWAYLWWKSRKLRQQIHKQPGNVRIIEGEVIRGAEQGDRLLR
jgi:Flp pilus assembly protein TadB